MTGFRSPALGLLAVLLAGSLAIADQSQRITPNFKDADITQIAEAVAAATGKNFIIDPRVRAQVTMLSSTPMSRRGVLPGIPLDPRRLRLHRRARGRGGQDPPRCERPPGALDRSARACEQHLRRDRDAGARGEERPGESAGADPAAAGAAVRASAGLSQRQHPHHHRPREQREPIDPHHPPDRPDRQPGSGDHPAAERVRLRDRARDQLALPGRRGERHQGGGGRALQQRADRRRWVAAAAAARADRAPGHPARERR